MPTPDTQGVPPFADFDMIKNKINEIVQKYNNLLVNLDSLNVVSVTADHIDAGTIDANVVTIAANDGTGKFYRIDTNGIVANNGSFNTLLFDLATGLLTVTAALIQSATGYPKVEINSANNIIAAYSAPGTYLGVTPLGTGSVPAISLVASNSTVGYLNRVPLGGTSLGTFGGENLNFQSNGNLNAQANGNMNFTPSGNVTINGFTGRSGTYYVSSAPGGPADTQVVFHKGFHRN